MYTHSNITPGTHANRRNPTIGKQTDENSQTVENQTTNDYQPANFNYFLHSPRFFFLAFTKELAPQGGQVSPAGERMPTKDQGQGLETIIWGG